MAEQRWWWVVTREPLAQRAGLDAERSKGKSWPDPPHPATCCPVSQERRRASPRSERRGRRRCSSLPPARAGTAAAPPGGACHVGKAPPDETPALAAAPLQSAEAAPAAAAGEAGAACWPPGRARQGCRLVHPVPAQCVAVQPALAAWLEAWPRLRQAAARPTCRLLPPLRWPLEPPRQPTQQPGREQVLAPWTASAAAPALRLQALARAAPLVAPRAAPAPPAAGQLAAALRAAQREPALELLPLRPPPPPAPHPLTSPTPVALPSKHLQVKKWSEVRVGGQLCSRYAGAQQRRPAALTHAPPAAGLLAATLGGDGTHGAGQALVLLRGGRGWGGAVGNARCRVSGSLPSIPTTMHFFF